MKIFFERLSKADMKAAILKITEPYALDFVPKLYSDVFPTPIAEMYNPKMLESDWMALLAECERVFFDLKVINHDTFMSLAA